SSWRSGVRRPHPWLVTTDREARSLPDPDEGSALDGCTGLDERRRQCRPDNVKVNTSGPGQEVRGPCKKSPRWSAGRRACSIARARGRLTRCPVVTSAVPALRPLMPEGEEDQGASPAPALKGPMAHACMLGGAASRCLKCESE